MRGALQVRRMMPRHAMGLCEGVLRDASALQASLAGGVPQHRLPNSQRGRSGRKRPPKGSTSGCFRFTTFFHEVSALSGGKRTGRASCKFTNTYNSFPTCGRIAGNTLFYIAWAITSSPYAVRFLGRGGCLPGELRGSVPFFVRRRHWVLIKWMKKCQYLLSRFPMVYAIRPHLKSA